MRWRKKEEILAIWLFWLTFKKVAAGFQYRADDVLGFTRILVMQGGARCPAYGFGVVRLTVQPKCCTFLYKVELMG